MKELNTILTELGISKVRLAEYLGVSRQMLYNYLGIDDISNWPQEKAAKLLSLLNIEDINGLKDSLDATPINEFSLRMALKYEVRIGAEVEDDESNYYSTIKEAFDAKSRYACAQVAYGKYKICKS